MISSSQPFHHVELISVREKRELHYAIKRKCNYKRTIEEHKKYYEKGIKSYDTENVRHSRMALLFEVENAVFTKSLSSSCYSEYVHYDSSTLVASRMPEKYAPCTVPL